MYTTMKVWVPAGLGGACSGRSKSCELATNHDIRGSARNIFKYHGFSSERKSKSKTFRHVQNLRRQKAKYWILVLKRKNTCSCGSAYGTNRAKQKSFKQQYLPAAAAASTNRQKCNLSCAPRHSLSKQRRQNEKIALLIRCPLRPTRGRSGEDQDRGGKGSRACSSGSSSISRKQQQQRLQQLLQHRLREAVLLLTAALA